MKKGAGYFVVGFALLFIFVQFISAIDNIQFVNPTPTENVTGNSIYVNLSTSDEGEHYSFVDFDRDLVLWMRMDDSNGTVFYDLSSYGNNGTTSGTVVTNTTNGVFGNGSRFNAASKINIVSSSSLNSPGITEQITVCAWINIFSHGTGYKGIVGKWKNNERQYLLAKKTDTNQYGLILSRNGLVHSTNGAELYTNSALNTSQWYHLCGTYNGTNMYIYLNSQKQTGTANSQGIFENATGPLEIGTFFQSFTYGFNGNVDEVMVFKRGLSEREIKSIYNASAYQYESNFANLANGSHTFIGYAVGKDSDVDSISRTIFSGFLNESNQTAGNETGNETQNNVSSYLNLEFKSPTPILNSTSSSIYVNLSTNASSRHYSFVDFDNDLILWMKLDNESGGISEDLSSYGNDGLLSNVSLGSEYGYFGAGAYFNDNGYVEIPDSQSLNSPGITNQVTVCTWFKTAQHGSTFRGLVGRYNTLSGSNDRQYLLAENSADNKYGIFLSSDGTTYQASVLTNSELNTNQWYHLCGTTNGTVSLYLDGVKQSGTATLANIKDSVNTSTFIGKFVRLDAEFNGSIDEVLVFNRGLSEREIKAIYDASAYQYENNYTGLTSGNHGFIGYAADINGNLSSISRNIQVFSESSNQTQNVSFEIVLSSSNNQVNSHLLNITTNLPADNCWFSSDNWLTNTSMNKSNDYNFYYNYQYGSYEIDFQCINSNGSASLSDQEFTFVKSLSVVNDYYTNSEGLDIYFDFYFNYTSEKGDLVVIPDSWASTKSSYVGTGYVFRDAGYSVVLVDTRGKGSSEGSRGAFLEECADIYEVIDEVRTNPAYSGYVSNRVYVWGFSAGGGRAGACSARYPDLFSAIFSTGGVLNVSKWYELNSVYRADLEARIGGTPTTNQEGYLIRDASYLNYNALAPAMVTAYTADASVNVALSRAYNASMNYNGKEIRYDEYPGGSHAIVGLSDSVLYFANHTEIYSIPSNGDFVIGSFLKTKNFSINLNNVSFRGFVNYNISSEDKLFNITTLNYTTNATLKVSDLAPNTNYSVFFNGLYNLTKLSDVNGNILFNVNINSESAVFVNVSLGDAPETPDVLSNISLETPEVSVKFKARIVSSNGIKSVSLWGNWGGAWQIDQTNSSGLNDAVYQFEKELSPGTYRWAIGIYDLSGNFALSENKTISIDY